MIRGEIWRVELGPTIGTEMQKTRPCLVISASRFDALGVRIVVPLTHWEGRYEGYPNRLRIRATTMNGLTTDSAVDAMQIRSASIERFANRLGTVDDETLDDVAALVAMTIGYR